MSNLRFGIELELANLDYDFAKYKFKTQKNAIQYTEFGPLYIYGKAWKLEKDTSIQSKFGFEGVELVSPILTIDDLSVYHKVVNDLFEFGASVDDSCGMHIHVDGAKFDSHSLQRLQLKFANEQDKLYDEFDCISSNGKYKKYCKKLPQQYIEKLKALKNPTMLELARLWYEELGTGYPPRGYKSNISRYYGLNLHSFFATHGTIEFRFFRSTNDLNEIDDAVKFCLNFCENALKGE